MPPVARPVLALSLLFGLAFAAHAQGRQPPEDVPAVVEIRHATARDRDRREALHQYVLGLVCEREDRLVEALKAWETSAKLDPEAAATFRGLVALYVALERPADALAATETVLRLDPQDYRTWFFYARQLRAGDKLKEAAAALRKGLGCAAVKEQTALCQQMYHDLGVLSERTGDAAAAIAAFGQSAALLDSLDAIADVEGLNRQEIQMRAADLYERTGRAYLQQKKYEQAIAAFQKAQAKYPEGAGRLNFNLAQVCLDGGRVADALIYLDNYLRLLPQGTDAYELKIKLLHQAKRGGEIVPWLEKVVAQDRYNLGLKWLFAQQLALAGRVDQAEQVYLTLLDDAPSANVYRGLFALYRGEGQPGMLRALAVIDDRIAQARQRREQGSAQSSAPVQGLIGAARGDAEFAGPLVKAAVLPRKKELQVETTHFLAVLAEHHHLYPEAEQLFRCCLANLTDPEFGAIVNGGLLRVLWKAHRYEQVTEVCRKALEEPKAKHAVLFRSELARALVLLGKADDGLAEADRALEAATAAERPHLLQLRVRLLAQAERFDQAEKVCLALLKDAVLPGDKLELRYLLSGVFSSAHQQAKAEEQLGQCLVIDPNSASVNNDLGYLWADQNKNLAEAEAMIRKAIDLDRQQRKTRLPFGVDAEESQDNAAYMDSLGWVLFRRGKFEEARRELETATTLPGSEDPVIWDHLGDTYDRLGRAAQARQAWQRALDFYGPGQGRKMDERYNELQRKLTGQGKQVQSR
jgi:tetratricopeptide (TPR) repeat protein